MLRVSNFAQTDLLVFSHVRWDFVFQRPQQLMSRFAKKRRVFFVEEPIIGTSTEASYRIHQNDQKIQVVLPCLPEGLNEIATQQELKKLIDHLLFQEEIDDFTSWYYSPTALSYTGHLKPKITIYDCMDESSTSEIVLLEEELLKRADLVFTSGQSLYEMKRHRHPHTYYFPSSIDIIHFKQARLKRQDPAEQTLVHGKRVGFYGVIDERFDIELLTEISRLRPQWQFIILGPVVKIDPRTLPRRSNIHYLGLKSYQELPDYLSRWDLAILPIVRSEITRFASPTKTPEYLAAGCPVVSTSLPDVVKPYAEAGLVYVADTPATFIEAAENAIQRATRNREWIQRVDDFLADKSWDNTVDQMVTLEQQTRLKKFGKSTSSKPTAEKSNPTTLKA